MHLSVHTTSTPSGDTQYRWELFDGPDGIDHFTGTESSLGLVFEEVVKALTHNALSYR